MQNNNKKKPVNKNQKNNKNNKHGRIIYIPNVITTSNSLFRITEIIEEEYRN